MQERFPDVKRNGQPRHHWHIFLSRWRAAGQLGKQLLALAVSWFREPLAAARLGAVRFKVVVRDAADAAAAHHQDRREARNCFNEGGVRILFSVTDEAARPMVFSRQQPSGELVEFSRVLVR